MPKFIDKEKIKEKLDNGLYEQYLNGEINQKQLSKTLAISTDILRDIFDKFGYITKQCYEQNHINHEFFNKIETEEQAYIIGFYLADGYLDETNHRVIFNINENDVEILERIKKLISPNQNIYKASSRPNKNGYISKPLVGIRINSKQLTADLIKHGIGSRKTYNSNIDLSFIPDNLMIHFIRGYFDGDGTVYFKRVKKKIGNKTYITENCNWSIISHCSNHLYQIQDFLLKKHGIKANILEDSKGNFLISINRKDDFMKMRNVLYDNAHISLTRKKDKYENIVFTNTPLKRKVKLIENEKEIVFDTMHQCAEYLGVTSTSIRNWIKTPDKSKYKLEYV